MTADPLLVAARAIHFAALLVLFGSALFPFYAPEAAAPLRGILSKILRVAALVAVPSGLLWLALMAADMAGGFSEVFDPDFLRIFFLETPFGAPVAARLALFVGLLAFGLWPSDDAPWRGFGLFLGAGLLIDQAWLGHAAQGQVVVLPALYVLHVLAGAFWLGALPPLLSALRPDPATPILLRRFSHLATPIVLALLASGAIMLWAHAGAALPELWPSAYGQILTIKLLFVTLALALALFNRLVAVPALARGHSSVLRLSLIAEIAAGLAILLAAAALGVTPPP